MWVFLTILLAEKGVNTDQQNEGKLSAAGSGIAAKTLLPTARKNHQLVFPPLVHETQLDPVRVHDPVLNADLV